MNYTLIKLSGEGFEIQFKYENDLYDELLNYICDNCLIEYYDYYDYIPNTYDDLLSTSCGCEFRVEENI